MVGGLEGFPAWAVVRVIGFGPKVGGVLAYECVACEEPYIRGEDRSGKFGDVLYEARESCPGGLWGKVRRAQWQAVVYAAR